MKAQPISCESDISLDILKAFIQIAIDMKSEYFLNRYFALDTLFLGTGLKYREVSRKINGGARIAAGFIYKCHGHRFHSGIKVIILTISFIKARLID